VTDTANTVRAAVAAAHGLPEQAAGLLTGESLHELEQSAEGLAQLLADHRPQEAEPSPPPDPITAALATKTARKRELADRLLGRAAQPRDEHGRFASASFDGGARPSVPVPKDPVAEHDRLVGHLAWLRRTFAG
jgi:hypothetical protein